MKLIFQNPAFACLISIVAVLVVLDGCGNFHPHERQTGRLLESKVTAGRVQAALTNNPSYKFPHVQVAATEGIVVLSGYVENEGQRQEAAVLAQSVNEVKKVENDLQLRPVLIPMNRISITGAPHAH